MDLECGCSSGVGGGGVGGGVGGAGGVHRRNEEEESNVSVCSSDADDNSCYSQFYSTVDGEGSHDNYSFEDDEIAEEVAAELRRLSELRRALDVSVVVIESGDGEVKVNLGRVEKDCRICHLSLLDISSSNSSENGVAIELGCSCKGDLAAAHKNCAETWFKIKGDKTCEICNSIARNIVGPHDVEQLQQQMNETHTLAIDTVAALVFPHTETRTCINGHRFLNFILACMVFAFVISWLFHFNISS